MDLFLWILVLLIPSIAFGFIAKYIAKSKGYDSGFAWGFWLGIIGLLVVGFRPTISQSVTSGAESEYWQRISNPVGRKSQGSWHCVCGQENSYGLDYCTRCCRTKAESDKVSTPKVTCPHCGAQNRVSNTFCFACNRELNETSSTSIAAHFVATDVSAAPTTAADIADDAKGTQEIIPDGSGIVAELDILKKLAELRDLGILTEAEFNEKKSNILSKL